MKITERRIVRQDWYETECSKTGWESHGWYFNDGSLINPIDWEIKEHIHLDKFGNPIYGIAEKETEIII